MKQVQRHRRAQQRLIEGFRHVESERTGLRQPWDNRVAQLSNATHTPRVAAHNAQAARATIGVSSIQNSIKRTAILGSAPACRAPVQICSCRALNASTARAIDLAAQDVQDMQKRPQELDIAGR
jgi:hypothetical protein